jgi:hypothetical protein
LEKLKRQSFLDKKTIFEEEVKALNYRKWILKRITTESKFMSDLKEEWFKKIETKKVTERWEWMYRDLNSIRSEYNLYKKINIDKLISYLWDFNQCYNYEKEKQNKETNLRIEKLKKIKNLIETYRDNIKEKRKNFENIIVNELSQYVRKYSKSIIKYNSLWDIIIQWEEWRWITIGLEWNKKWSPEFTFSQWQLAWVALSCVLAFYKKVISQKVKLRILLIDDPIQTIDDLNALNLINILRYDFSDSQVILSTHAENFDKLIRYKYQVLWKKQKWINMSNM